MIKLIGTLTLHPRPRERWAFEKNGELCFNFAIGESRADAVRILASYGYVVGEDGSVWGPDQVQQLDAGLADPINTSET